MKRLILIIFAIILLVFCNGCKAENTESVREAVIINMPVDNTVNGYRTGSSISSSESDKIDANKVTVESKTTSSKTENETVTEVSYCANLKSKVFHKSDCGAVKSMKEENKFYTKDKSILLEQGYTPCKSCKP